ncbi:unnamed protein product, partial [Pylaiella littoralis]
MDVIEQSWFSGGWIGLPPAVGRCRLSCTSCVHPVGHTVLYTLDEGEEERGNKWTGVILEIFLCRRFMGFEREGHTHWTRARRKGEINGLGLSWRFFCVGVS